MSSSVASAPTSGSAVTLSLVARWQNLRALAWDRTLLYASRGYELLRADFSSGSAPAEIGWEHVATFRPSQWRSISVSNRLTSRLFRDGFHTLAVSQSGTLVGTVPGAIITLRRGEKEFHVSHVIPRGTRPLHIAIAPNGRFYWGEYFDNASREEVHIYGSSDQGESWRIAHTFPKGAVRHVHNVVHDPWGDCLWILTGDYGDECRILRASYDLRRVETVLQGNQQARAVAMVPTEKGLFFASDTPLEKNYVYRMDRSGTISRLVPLSGSSIYGCRVEGNIFFSTLVEPSEVNPDQHVRVYGARVDQVDEKTWPALLAWRKDHWSMRFFQYGNAFLPEGKNDTNFLAVSTIAVQSDDMATSLYAVAA